MYGCIFNNSLGGRNTVLNKAYVPPRTKSSIYWSTSLEQGKWSRRRIDLKCSSIIRQRVQESIEYSKPLNFEKANTDNRNANKRMWSVCSTWSCARESTL